MKIRDKLQRGSSSFVMVYFLISCTGSSIAQQRPAYLQTPTFRVQSSLVVVDVISHDPKSGLPIRDFKKEDFRLFDNKHEVRITTFDAGARYDTRPITVWLVVICNESGLPKFGASAEFLGQESLFRPALNDLEAHDTVGVAHWCDNGDSQIDMSPTEDRDKVIEELGEALKPIPFEGGTRTGDEAGELAFRNVIRLIIRDAYGRNPKPLPVIVFLHGDHTGQPHGELNKLVDDFLETSGIVFGVRDSRSPNLHFIIGEQAEIMHYMARDTGGEYFSESPSGYEAALEAILLQLHFRYELGFIPPALDGKRHELRVVHLEADLMDGVPDIGLEGMTFSVDYGLVQRTAEKDGFWLPHAIDTYWDFDTHRSILAHRLDDFRLFTVETKEEVQELKKP